MSAFKRAPAAGGARRLDVIAPLKAVQIVGSNPVLPAEIMSAILDYLPVPELLRFARVSKRMQEMVYDDTRWVQRLQMIGCWNEREARKKTDALKTQALEAQRLLQENNNETGGNAPNRVSDTRNDAGKLSGSRTTIFDATKEKDGLSGSQRVSSRPHKVGLDDGFDSVPLTPNPQTATRSSPTSVDGLTVFLQVHSERGYARQEYARIYRVLAPLYIDAARCQTHTDATIFRTYRDPNQQAQILANLKRFSNNDTSQGWHLRVERFTSLMTTFEHAVFQEFEHGLDTGDFQGKLHKYAQVLVSLNGGKNGVEAFISRNPILREKKKIGDPMACFEQSADKSNHVDQSFKFFNTLSSAFNEQVSIIDQVFPPSINAIVPLLRRVSGEVLSEYLTILFDEAHRRNVETYLRVFSTTYAQSLNFATSLQPSRESGDGFYEAVDEAISNAFEPHIDLYLNEEVEFFKRKSDTEVGDWRRQLSDQDASMQSMYMSNVNRQADKRDFLASFKKVVMMPVNVLPTFPMSSPFGGKPATAKALANGEGLETLQTATSRPSTRSSTPGITNGTTLSNNRSSTPVPEQPTTELAAKTAIMNSRLEGIRSLFSIEVALNLVHAAKSSIERTAVLVKAGGHFGRDARDQCKLVFVLLLQTLGTRHIKSGFDQAVDHLSKYNPQEASGHGASGVTPLVIFLELVNVGDLIQQMLDVFYEQELIATRLTDRNDFLDPAVKEKKRFEQMLDERVAAGLNKGIDVLMAEVEYMCATTQKSEDFDPPAFSEVAMDLGPSRTAKQVVELVSSHTKLLVGSTEKNMLDVFNQEVGLRLFTTLCKHLKRQRISVAGALVLISDMNHYGLYISTLRNADLTHYFGALRALAQIYLVGPAHAQELAAIIADGERFGGIFRAEEVYEFAERRADWTVVKRGVEKGLYGRGCVIM